MRAASKKLVFFHIRQGQHEVQVLASEGQYEFLGDAAEADREEAGPPPLRQSFRAVHRALRRGDIVGIEGFPGKSGKGEVSVIPRRTVLLSPCADNLPETGKFSNRELRSRRRELDMVVNKEASIRPLRARAAVLRGIRAALDEDGFVEVETPVLSAVAGGAAAQPFVTAASALKGTHLELRVAPELELKRLVVGGLDRVYEIGRCFRNEGIDATHNPEFTTLEFYEAFAGCEELIDRAQQLIANCGEQILRLDGGSGGLDADGFGVHRAGDGRLLCRVPLAFVERGVSGRAVDPTPALRANHAADGFVEIDLSSPFRRIDIGQELRRVLQLDGPLPDPNDIDCQMTVDVYRQLLGSVGIEWREPLTAAKAVDLLVEHLIEPHCVQPTLLMGHPLVTSPLARQRDVDFDGQSPSFRRMRQTPQVVFPGVPPDLFNPGGDPKSAVADRFELFICGREFCNAYAELNDPQEQRRRFTLQERIQSRSVHADEDRHASSEPFCRALDLGLPPTGGFGLGVDRLVMLLSARDHIRDVIAFPMMATQDQARDAAAADDESEQDA